MRGKKNNNCNQICMQQCHLTCNLYVENEITVIESTGSNSSKLQLTYSSVMKATTKTKTTKSIT